MAAISKCREHLRTYTAADYNGVPHLRGCPNRSPRYAGYPRRMVLPRFGKTHFLYQPRLEVLRRSADLRWPRRRCIPDVVWTNEDSAMESPGRFLNDACTKNSKY